MRNLSMNAHDIKEIRLVYGDTEDGLGHLLRVIIVDNNDNDSDISLFGMKDSIRIPVKLDEKIMTTRHNISFIGELKGEEE
jgi:hypothetical protein